MTTYQFAQFASTITDPTITVSQVIDSMNDTCSVVVNLTSGSTELAVKLDGFTYTNNKWEDADISAWVAEKLKEFETK